jgi:hypothetical protein
LLDEARSVAWTQAKAVGEGEELRAEFNGKVGSALLLDGALVHTGAWWPERRERGRRLRVSLGGHLRCAAALPSAAEQAAATGRWSP